MTIAQKLNVMPAERQRMPEQNLWKSVVLQAIHDAFSKNEFYRWRAWAWFYNNSVDYQRVCEMADFSPNLLRETMIEAVFYNHLIQKGAFIMKKGTKTQVKVEWPDSAPKIRQSRTSLTKQFDIARRAKAILRAIYNQQELHKAIGSLTLQDILNICEQSDFELEAEMGDYND
jgi:hypothetical protein